MKSSLSKLVLISCLCLPAFGQYVAVTFQLDKASMTVGETNVVHVFGQVVAAERATSERIFSWYVDFLNNTPQVAEADYSKLLKPPSDKDPQTSSFGFTDGANRRGIYDTFRIDTPASKSGFGVNAPVELFSVPVKAAAAGLATFRVVAGTGVSGLTADFIVAPQGGGDPLIGGVYDLATASIQIAEAQLCTPRLLVSTTSLTGGLRQINLSFTPCAGHTPVVEFVDKIGNTNWTALPNGPHNSGSVTDTNSFKTRFYRVRVAP